MKRKILALLTSLIALTSVSMIVSCKPESNEYNVTINKTSTTIGLFENEQLEITSLIPEGMTAVWTSSDENIVSVNANGLISGLYPGSATITVTIGDIVAECHVVVESTDILQVETNVIDNYMEMVIDSSVTVLPSVFFKGSPITDAEITYASADPSVATVENGVITAVSMGETEVLVSALYRGIEGECVISVNVKNDLLLVAPVEADVYALDIYEDGTTPNTFELTPKLEKNGVECTDAVFTYELVDDTYATIDEHGIITGVKGGQTNVVIKTEVDGDTISTTTKINVLRGIVDLKEKTVNAERYGMIYTEQSDAVVTLTADITSYFDANDLVAVMLNETALDYRVVDDTTLTLPVNKGLCALRFVTEKANYDVQVNFVEEGVKGLSLYNMINPYGNKYSYTQYKQYHISKLTGTDAWHNDGRAVGDMDLVQMFYGNGATGNTADYPIPAEGMWDRENTDIAFSFMSDYIGDINVSDYKYLVFDMKIITGDGANVLPDGGQEWVPWAGQISFGFGNRNHVELKPGEFLNDKDFGACGGKIGSIVDGKGDVTAYKTDEWCTVVIDISKAYELLKDDTSYDGLERFFRVSLIGVPRYANAIFANAHLVNEKSYDFSSYEVDFGTEGDYLVDEAFPVIVAGGVEISDYEMTTSDSNLVAVEGGKFVAKATEGTVVLSIKFKLANGIEKTVTKEVSILDKNKPFDVAFDKDSVEVEKGAYTEISITSNVPMGSTVVWSSSNESIATVSQDGQIIGVGAGETEIIVTITYNGVDSEGRVSVTVNPVSATKALTLGDMINPYGNKYSYTQYKQYHISKFVNDSCWWYNEVNIGEGMDIVQMFYGNGATGNVADYPIPAEGMWSREDTDMAFSFMSDILQLADISDYKYLVFEMKILNEGGANVENPVGSGNWEPWCGNLTLGFGNCSYVELAPGEYLNEKVFSGGLGKVAKIVDENGDPVAYQPNTWCKVVIDISKAYELLKEDTSYNGLERFFRISLIGAGRYANAAFMNGRLVTEEEYNKTSYEVDFGLVDGEIVDEATPIVIVGGVHTTQVELISSNTEIVAVADGKFVLAGGVGDVTLTVKFTLKDGTEKTISQKVTVINKVEPIEITLDKTSVTLEAGYYEKVNVTSTIPNGSVVEWTTSNEAVATVTDGKIIAVGAGTAEVTIKITLSGVESTAKVSVTVAPVKAEKSLQLANIINPYGGETGKYKEYAQYKNYAKGVNEVVWGNYDRTYEEGKDIVQMFVVGGSDNNNGGFKDRESNDIGFSFTSEITGMADMSGYKYLVFEMITDNSQANISFDGGQHFEPWNGTIQLGFGDKNYVELAAGDLLSTKDFGACGGVGIGKILDANGDETTYKVNEWNKIVIDISAAYELLKSDEGFNGLERLFRVTLKGAPNYANLCFRNASLITVDGYAAEFGE